MHLQVHSSSLWLVSAFSTELNIHVEAFLFLKVTPISVPVESKLGPSFTASQSSSEMHAFPLAIAWFAGHRSWVRCCQPNPPTITKKHRKKPNKTDAYLERKAWCCQFAVICLSVLPSKGTDHQSMKSLDEGCCVCDLRWILWQPRKC